jgi:hypothetical protein
VERLLRCLAAKIVTSSRKIARDKHSSFLHPSAAKTKKNCNVDTQVCLEAQVQVSRKVLNEGEAESGT